MTDGAAWRWKVDTHKETIKKILPRTCNLLLILYTISQNMYQNV